MNNSFKELEKLHLEQFEKKSPQVKEQIEGTTSSYKFIGDILDLYFNKIMGVFIAMTGGDMEIKTTDSETSKKPPQE